MSIKGQGYCLTLIKGHSNVKFKTCFFSKKKKKKDKKTKRQKKKKKKKKKIGSFDSKFHFTALERMGMEIQTSWVK